MGYLFNALHAPAAIDANFEFVIACAGDDTKMVVALDHLRLEEMTARPIFDLDDPHIGIET